MKPKPNRNFEHGSVGFSRFFFNYIYKQITSKVEPLYDDILYIPVIVMCHGFQSTDQPLQN